MFVFEGKTGLRKIFDRYMRAITPVFMGVFVDTTTTFRRSKDVDVAISEVACKLCWRFLELYPEAYVLAPSGQLIRLDYEVWTSPFELHQPLNGVVNLKSGLLHSSDEHTRYQPSASSAEFISPFEGCPVFLVDDDDLLFEDDEVFEDEGYSWRRSPSYLQPRKSSFLMRELDEWLEFRAPMNGVLRPPIVEVQFLEGEAESPDDVDSRMEDNFVEKVEISPNEMYADTIAGSKVCSNQIISRTVKQVYPDGKNDATWSEVETKVGYSRRSIVRALKALDQYNEWAKHGQNTQ